MQQPSKAIRDRQLVALFEVLTFIMTPSECFHCTMEKYFEQDTVGAEKQPCEKYSSFCTGGHKQITGVFGKTQLSGFLIDFCNGKSQTTDAFLKALKGKKDKIFEVGSVPNKVAGPIHALTLQLLAVEQSKLIKVF